MIKFLKDFKNNEDGLAAIEFALTLPLLTILYFGTIEASMMVETDRRVTSTASTIADLVSRTREVNYCEIEDIFYASSRIIRQQVQRTSENANYQHNARPSLRKECC